MQGIPVRMPIDMFDRTSDKVLVCIPSNFRDMCLALTGDSLFWSATWQQELTSEQLALINEGIAGLQDDFGDCVDFQNEIDDIVTRLEELENLNICISCGCGNSSGSCGCGTADTTNPGDGVRIVPPSPDEDSQPTDPTYLDYKCDLSHYLFYLFRDVELPALLGLQQSGELSFDEIALTLEGIFGGLMPLFGLVWTVFYTIVIWIVNGLTDQDAVTALQTICDRNKDALICAMYTSINMWDALESVSDVFAADTVASWHWRTGLVYLSQTIPYETLFFAEADRTELPPEFIGSECVCSGGVPVGCSDDFGGSYPSLSANGLVDWCYQSVTDLQAVGQLGSYGQQAIILGFTYRIVGTNHPGNQWIGFLVFPGTRPPDAYALCITVATTHSNLFLDGRIGAAAGTTLITGGGTEIVANTKTYIGYVDPLINPVALPIQDNLISEFDNPEEGMIDVPTGGDIFLGLESGTSLAGDSYDITFYNFAWLRKTTP